MKNKLIYGVFLSVLLFAWGRAEGMPSAVVESDATVALKNDSVRIDFSKEGPFDIVGLRFGGKQLVSKKGANYYPWLLTYKGPQGENPLLRPSTGIYHGYKEVSTGGNAALEFRWSLILTYEDTVPVRMTVTLPDNSGLLRWNIEAGTPDGWVVSNTEFPRITVDRPDDGKLITSGGWGAEYTLSLPRTYYSEYPSVTGAMQMMLLHNNDGAFYYATYDKEACGKQYQAVVTTGSVTLLTSIVNSEGWSNQDGIYVMPWTAVMGFSAEGWRDAAVRWYRPFTFETEWGNKTLAQRGIPQWLLDTDTWIRVKGISKEAVDAVHKSIDLYGEGLFVHWYYWHNYPYDTHYPDYFPAKPGFDKLVAGVQARGCHTVPYINGRLWDPDADSYKALGGASASCRKPDGTLYTEIYPTSKVLNTVTCPASGLWRGIIAGLVDRIQKELHTNGVYIDQIAAAAPQPCWAGNHGHAKGGGSYWPKAYRHLVDSIRANFLQPGNILVSEENAECYIDKFDVLLTVNSPHGDCHIVPLFPIVYSDRLITSAYTYHPNDRVNRGDFLYQTMQCFLYGSQLGWVDPVLLMRDEAKREAQFLKTLSELRKGQHDVFVGGRYIREIIPSGDNPKVDVVGFGNYNVVCGSEWLSADGKKVQYYVNMDGKDHSVVLPDGKGITVKALSGLRIDY